MLHDAGKILPPHNKAEMIQVAVRFCAGPRSTLLGRKEIDDRARIDAYGRETDLAAAEFFQAFGLEAAQVVLGHSHANTTEIYAERDAAKGVEVAKAIG